MSSKPLNLRTLLAAALGVVALLVPAASASAAAPAYMGVQLTTTWVEMGSDDLGRELEGVRDLGGNVVRVNVGWASLQESGPSTWSGWYVDRLDALVDAANARGIKVIATLMDAPCWASSAPDPIKLGCAGAWWSRNVDSYAPTDPAAYAKAARYLTARYGTKLAALEMENEPNLPYEFLTADKPGALAALARATYPQAKAGNADVPVLIGSLAYADTAFLRSLYAAGISGAYDGISLHPYSDGRAPGSTVGPAEHNLVAGLRTLRATQVAAGDSAPLWVTEYGWTTCSGAGCTSPADQASYTAQSVGLLGDLPYVRGASLYELRDNSTDAGSSEGNFGLLRHDFSPKPAFAALKAAIAGGRVATTAPKASGGGSAGSSASGASSSGAGATTPVRTSAKSTASSDDEPGRLATVTHSDLSSIGLSVAVSRGRYVVRGKVRMGAEVKVSVVRKRKGRTVSLRRLSGRPTASGSFRAVLGRTARLRGGRLAVRVGDGRVHMHRLG